MDTVQTLLVKMRRAYLGEVPACLDSAKHSIIALQDYGYDEAIFSNLYRQVHDLNAAAASHGLKIISTICLPLEDYLGTALGTEEKISIGFSDAVLAYIDLLREAHALLDHNQESFQDIEAKLIALRAGSLDTQRTALIVETSRLSVNLMLKTLQQFRFHVVVLEDGYAALGRVLAEPFDLLISSLEVRQLNGMALIAAMKLAQKKPQRTKAVLLSANTELQSQANGPDFVIPKDAQLAPNLKAILELIARG